MWLSNVTYTVAVSKCDGSTRLTHVFFGTPGKRVVISVHCPPSFVVSHTLPSSVPTQRIPGRTGDSATVVIVPWVSAPELSRVMPPVRRVLMMIRAESRVERSGEMG